MTATITKLPRRKLRPLAPISIKMDPRAIALALGGTGEPMRSDNPIRPPYFRCRCPLCDGPMRVAYEPCGDTIGIDCQHGCDPEVIVTNLLKRGLFTCRDARK